MAKTPKPRPVKETKVQLRAVSRMAALRLDTMGDINARLEWVLNGMDLSTAGESFIDSLLTFVIRYPERRAGLLSRFPALREALAAKILG